VRSANLAQLYADANLIDVAVREAGRGVVTDYSDYSAHLFLANSYENERRAGLSTLRLEAAAVSESLLARLLGPPSGYLLAQPVPQLDSTKLLERDGLGLTANTEFFSRGAWRHTSAQYGTLQNSSYSLNAEYLAEPGERRNQDFEIQLLEARIKQNITPRDSVLLEVLDYRSNGGDTLQHFDEANVSPEFRFDEKQNPRLLAGYHHEWSAQSHTLLLVGRVADTLETENPFFDFIARDFPGNKSVVSVPARDDFRNRVEVYTAEVQQIATFGRQSVIAGARLEYTEENVANVVSHPQPDDDKPLLGEQEPVSAQNLRATAYTTTLYVYDYVTLTEALRAMAGLAFTDQEIPVNTDIPPITSDREEQEQVSPKAGIVWSPKPWFNLRGGYTRSMIGSGLSQSMRLEPTHVAGLVQTFRNVVPRGSVASLDGADLDTAEIVWDAHLPDTYFSAGYQWLNTDRTRREGLFLAYPDPYRIFPPSRSLIREKIDFNEQVLELSARRLVSKEWSLGARYRLAYDKLEQNFPDYSEDRFTDVHLAKRSQSKAWLHTIELSVLYRHQSGWFGQIDGTWFSQEREHDAVDLRADDFWQLNVKAGYRFPRQRAEITVGVLNLLDSDYQLDPLNAHPDLPRSRTLYVRLLLNF
jgi:outer membrane receptor protein involved in Fe transport